MDKEDVHRYRERMNLKVSLIAEEIDWKREKETEWEEKEIGRIREI